MEETGKNDGMDFIWKLAELENTANIKAQKLIDLILNIRDRNDMPFVTNLKAYEEYLNLVKNYRREILMNRGNYFTSRPLSYSIQASHLADIIPDLKYDEDDGNNNLNTADSKIKDSDIYTATYQYNNGVDYVMSEFAKNSSANKEWSLRSLAVIAFKNEGIKPNENAANPIPQINTYYQRGVRNAVIYIIQILENQEINETKAG